MPNKKVRADDFYQILTVNVSARALRKLANAIQKNYHTIKTIPLSMIIKYDEKVPYLVAKIKHEHGKERRLDG